MPRLGCLRMYGSYRAHCVPIGYSASEYRDGAGRFAVCNWVWRGERRIYYCLGLPRTIYLDIIASVFLGDLPT